MVVALTVLLALVIPLLLAVGLRTHRPPWKGHSRTPSESDSDTIDGAAETGNQPRRFERPSEDSALLQVTALLDRGHSCISDAIDNYQPRLPQSANDSRIAIRSQELAIHYQPIISLATGRIVEFEALIDWHPTNATNPSRPLAAQSQEQGEDTSRIAPPSEIVLRQACRQARAWHRKFPQRTSFGVNVNLPDHLLSRPDCVGLIESILRETHLEPTCLHLEINESTLFAGWEQTAQVLSRLREYGLRIYLDDFGSDCSSLAYLQRLPVDTLKINRSFLDKLGRNEQSARTIKTMVHLGHNLGMDVVADGIETAEQLESITEMGCEYGQGAYFSRPVDTAAIEDMIAARLSFHTQAISPPIPTRRSIPLQANA